jgi:hypothetical protein
MAAAKGTRVTQREKRKMWDLYQTLGSYTKVAKRMRRSRDTVAKYVLEYETALQVAQLLTKKEESQI